jgi:hypothetical protein
MRRALLLPILMAASVAAPADLILPGAAHTSGLEGTQWATDLVVLNPHEIPVEVHMTFTPYSDSQPVSTSHALEPQQMLALDDVVSSAFGLEASGYITIHSAETLVAAQRTFNQTPDGATYGQLIPAVEAATSHAYLTGMRGGDFRTNLGLVNPGMTSLTVNVAVASGLQLELPSQGGVQLGQIDGWQEFNPAGESGSVAAATSVLCYASVVDNRTGDPTYVPGLQAESQAVIAGLAHSPGVNGTVWRSDLYLHAPVGATVLGTLVFYGRDGTLAAPQLVEDLEAGETRVLEDVIALLAPGHEGSAVLWLSTVSGPIVAFARTFNLSQGGTYGQALPAVPRSAYIQPPHSAALLFASRNADGAVGYRSNLGLVNPNLDPAGITVELLDAAGAMLGSGLVMVPPRSALQKDDVVQWLGVDSLDRGVIRLSAPVPFTSYLSAIDNRSGDASTITPSITGPG